MESVMMYDPDKVLIYRKGRRLKEAIWIFYTPIENVVALFDAYHEYGKY
jgi:hypothetical protein